MNKTAFLQCVEVFRFEAGHGIVPYNDMGLLILGVANTFIGQFHVLYWFETAKGLRYDNINGPGAHERYLDGWYRCGVNPF